MSKPLLIAGASGAVGRALIELLRAENRPLRALVRSADRARPLQGLIDDVRLADATDAGTLRGVCDGVEVVFSSLGASVAPNAPDKRSYADVDLAGNRNLLAEARRAGVRRFVYVSVYTAPAYAHTAYVRAHETFAAELKACGLEYAVLRPTGLFSAFGEMLPLARRGRIPLIGEGASQTNPMHEGDLAALCRQALLGDEPSLELDAGGPEVLTRRQIVELAFAAVNRPAQFMRAPAWSMRATGALVRPFNPRLGELLAFVAAASTSRCVAEVRGRRRLAEYLREKAAQSNESSAEPPLPSAALGT